MTGPPASRSFDSQTVIDRHDFNGDILELIEEAQKYILKNAPDVKFREIAHIFIASFERPSFAAEEEPPPQEVADSTIDKTIGKTIDKNLSTTEKAILDLIAVNPAITQKKMAKQLNLSEIGIRYNTDKLKAKGVLQRVGGKKAGRWEIIG